MNLQLPHHMQSQSQPPPAFSSPGPNAGVIYNTSPDQMVVAPYGGGRDKACNITGDPETMAAAATSNGHRISVSLRRDPFSTLSRVCLRFLPGSRCYTTAACSTVVAAHGGSLLQRITSTESYLARHATDYFVYSNVGAAADDDDTARPPPSLYLLPPYYSSSGTDPWWQQQISATGFLSRDVEAEFVVARLKTLWAKGDTTSGKAAELLLFRHGEWRVEWQRILVDDHEKDGGRDDLLLASWEPEAVVPLGDRHLCWVDFFYGVVVFSGVLDEGGLELRYVPYPEEAMDHGYRQRFLCTDARGAVKLVTVSPRRCSHCGCSQHATTTNTWTLKTTDATAWVLGTEIDMAVDSSELWELPNKPGYARNHLV